MGLGLAAPGATVQACWLLETPWSERSCSGTVLEKNGQGGGSGRVAQPTRDPRPATRDPRPGRWPGPRTRHCRQRRPRPCENHVETRAEPKSWPDLPTSPRLAEGLVRVSGVSCRGFSSCFGLQRAARLQGLQEQQGLEGGVSRVAGSARAG